MLFLSVTFALGIFSANTARAINNSRSDRIYYNTGADVVIDAYWRLESVEDDTSYVEIDMDDYENLAGVETATRVLRTDAKATSGAVQSDNVDLMAIEPGKFSQVAWFRNDLLPVHWWNYCSALVDFKPGVLASSSWEQKGVQLGDVISVKIGGQRLR